MGKGGIFDAGFGEILRSPSCRWEKKANFHLIHARKPGVTDPSLRDSSCYKFVHKLHYLSKVVGHGRPLPVIQYMNNCKPIAGADETGEQNARGREDQICGSHDINLGAQHPIVNVSSAPNGDRNYLSGDGAFLLPLCHPLDPVQQQCTNKTCVTVITPQL